MAKAKKRSEVEELKKKLADRIEKHDIDGKALIKAVYELAAYKKAKEENDDRFAQQNADLQQEIVELNMDLADMCKIKEQQYAKAEEFRTEMNKQTKMKEEERQAKLDALRGIGDLKLKLAAEERKQEEIQHEIEILHRSNSALVDKNNKLVATLEARTKVNEATLARCIALTDLNEALLKERGVVTPVVNEVVSERLHQNEKWGEQNHTDGTGGPIEIEHAKAAKSLCDTMFRDGKGAWRFILLEEVAEAFAESLPGNLRTELIQVAAVAVAWVEAIDRRLDGERRERLLPDAPTPG
jgi:hypothetical protein